MFNIQIVWWMKWIGIGRGKPYPCAQGKDYHGSVYKWRFRLGFVELRKWGGGRAERTIGTALIMPRAGRNETCGRSPTQKGRQGVNGLETGLEHVEPKCSGISTHPSYPGNLTNLKK
jgi:hypothetical protein